MKKGVFDSDEIYAMIHLLHIMNADLKDVTAVSVKVKAPYIIIYEQAGGIPVSREGKDHDGAGLV